MSVEMIIALVALVFLALLVAECPIGFALAGSGCLGLFLVRDVAFVEATLTDLPYDAVSSTSLAIIPMYVLLGMFALHGNLTSRLYSVAQTAFRRVPGGLGVATVGACSGFAAVTGSSVSTAATIGRLSVQEMKRYGYRDSLAAGTVAAAGTLGALIPPSVVMVIYGVMAEESIGQLLVGGIVPGVLSAIAYAAYLMVAARPKVAADTASLAMELEVLAGSGTTDKKLAMAGPRASELGGTVLTAGDGGLPEHEDMTLFSKARAVAWVSVIIGVVVLGIYTGVFTTSESAAVAAVIGALMVLVERLRHGARSVVQSVIKAFSETMHTTAMIFMILVGASIMSVFLTVTRVPYDFATWVTSLSLPDVVVILLVVLVLLALGIVLETMSILIITVPLLHPMVTALGYDGVWFGVLFVKVIEMGLITPPLGVNAFVVSGASGVPVERVFRGVVPFLAMDVVVIAIMIAFPDLIMWLPNLVAS